MIPAMAREAGVRLLRSVFCIQDVQIFQAAAGIEQDYGVVRAEESTGQKFLVGDQRCGAFGGGEDAFDFCPVARGFENFCVGGGEGEASAFLQDVEDQVVAIGFGDAQA